MNRHLRALDEHFAACGRYPFTAIAQTPNPNGNHNLIWSCDCGWFYWGVR